MSVELIQAELLRIWFTPALEGEEGVDAAARLSMKAEIERVSDLLTELWFSADYAWTTWNDADILTILRQWLPPGSPEESPFLQYAVPGQLTEFIAWLEPAIGQWAAQETQATTDRGIENSDYPRDPIPETRYYRWVDGEYLYSDEQDAPYVPGGAHWQSMDDRIGSQDLARPHYDPDTDRWRAPAGNGEYSYQNRETGQWERYHSDAAGWLPYDQASGTWFYQGQWRDDVPPAPPPGQPAALQRRAEALRRLFDAVPEARNLTPRQLHDAIAGARD